MRPLRSRAASISPVGLIGHLGQIGLIGLIGQIGLIGLIVLVLSGKPVWAQSGDHKTAAPNAGPKPVTQTQSFTQEGLTVEFSVAPVSSEPNSSFENSSAGVRKTSSVQAEPAAVLEGTDAIVRFKVWDANAGKPVSSLKPIAWIDRRSGNSPPDQKECREKIQSFLQPSFSSKAMLDLNAYFILVLNHEPNISVIDPLSGFGGSKLYTLVGLPGSGADWVKSADQKRLYVSLPEVNQVAVIDTLSWKVIANLDAGVRPTRLALQRDGRYLWIGNDAVEEKSSGVTIIDTVTLKPVAQLATGRGHHEITFTEDDSLAFVTNRDDGTLSVIDIRKLATVRDVRVGSLPTSLEFSALSKSLYVANEGDGTIVVLDGLGRQVENRMKAQPGLGVLRLMPTGRFGFAANKKTNTIYIFDVTSNSIVHAVATGPGADQITFTREFAYIRSTGHEFVSMIKLAELGKETAVSRFPAGQRAPRESSAQSFADAIIPAPEEGAVLVANPADKMIYYYTEGMAAPMGNFQNYRREPKALLVLDNSLREGVRGEYTTTVRFPSSGTFDVAFLLDSPRLVKCFEMSVAENPSLPKERVAALRIELVPPVTEALVGESFRVRFRLIDSGSQQAHANLDDLGVLVFLAPGIWQQRFPAKALESGAYEISFVPPQPGVYYVHFQSPTLNVRFNQIAPLIFHAKNHEKD